MKKTTYITPMNAKSAPFTSSAGGNFFTNDLSVHNAATIRSLYFRDLNESYFRLKSVSNTPFLEPFLIDFSEGDKVNFKFDLLFSTNNPGFQINAFYLGANRQTLLSETNIIDVQTLGKVGEFKNIDVDILLYRIPQGTRIVAFNLRLVNNNCDAVIKNITMTVESNNNKLDLYDNIISYDDNFEMKKMKNIYSQMDIVNTYKSNSSYSNSIISNGEIDFTGLPGGKYKGVVGQFYCNPNYNTVIVYFEYMLTRTDPLGNTHVLSLRSYDDNDVQVKESQVRFDPAISTEWVKYYGVFNFDSSNQKRIVFDIGNVAIAGLFKIRNVKISNPRYDASKKYEPNKIENIFNSINTTPNSN